MLLVAVIVVDGGSMAMLMRLLLLVVHGALGVLWHGGQRLGHVPIPPPLPVAPHANSLVEE